MDGPPHPFYEEKTECLRELSFTGHTFQISGTANKSTSRGRTEDDGHVGRQFESTFRVGMESSRVEPDLCRMTHPFGERHGAEKAERERDSGMVQADCQEEQSSRHFHHKRNGNEDVMYIAKRSPQDINKTIRTKDRKRSSIKEQYCKDSSIVSVKKKYAVSKTNKETYPSRKDQSEKRKKERKSDKENAGPSMNTFEDAIRSVQTEPKSFIELGSNICTTGELRSFVVKEKPKPKKKTSQLSFTVTDHEDHWHVTFSSNNNQQTQTIQTICKFLNLGAAAAAEAVTTARLVRNIYTFARCLLHFGGDRIVYYGTRHATLKKVIRHVKKETSGTESFEPCPEMYLKRKQAERDDDNPRIYDLLDQLLDRYDPTSLSEFERRLPREEFSLLMITMGRQYREQVSALIKHRRKKLYDIINNASLEENLERVATRDPNLNNMNWLEYMFQKNEIFLPKFLAWMKIIAERRVEKVNTLVLQGPTNSGKSLILRGVLQNLNTVCLTKMKDSSFFSLESLLGKNFAILEEPKILPATLDSHKLLLGGEYCETPVRHGEDELLSRIPIFISISHPLGNCISLEEGRALHTRTKTFILQKEIEGVSDCSFTSAARMLRPPPPNICEADWLGLYRNYKEDIEDFILYNLRIPFQRRP